MIESTSEDELTPRMRRVTRATASKARVDPSTMYRIAVDLSMVSVMSATVFWDTEEQFTETATKIVDPQLHLHLPGLWAAACEEAEAVVAALARVALVAKRYLCSTLAKQCQTNQT